MVEREVRVIVAGLQRKVCIYTGILVAVWKR